MFFRTTPFAVAMRGKGKGSLRLAANHCQFNSSRFTASGANHVRAETRTRHKTGNADLTELRLCYQGIYLANGTGIQTSVGNNVAIEVAIEWPNAPTVVVRVKWNGADSGTIVNGVAKYMSDPVYPRQFGLSKFPKNTIFWVRRLSSVTQAQFYGRHDASSTTGERTAFSDGLSASQLMNSGAMNLPAGGADASGIMGPVAILGRASGAPDISVILVGDSITTGSNDNNLGGDGEAGGGWMVRGLWSVNSRSIPWMKCSVGGATAQNLNANTGWLEYLSYFTHGIVGPGTNDLAVGGRTSAQTLTDLSGIRSKLKIGGIRWVAEGLIFPRVSTTDAYATLVNQTPVTQFTTGGTRRDPVNAGIISAVGVDNLDQVLNVNTIAADATALDKWVVSGAANYATSDGVHPTPAIHALLAPVLSIPAASWV